MRENWGRWLVVLIEFLLKLAGVVSYVSVVILDFSGFLVFELMLCEVEELYRWVLFEYLI